MLSRSHPHRPLVAFVLGLSRHHRYLLSDKREDLDKAICHYTETILSLPLSQSLCGPMILDALFFLADALLKRSILSKKPEDASYATKFLFHLRYRPRVISDDRSHFITQKLVIAFALQVELETGNVRRNIREMAILCHELFTSGLDMSGIFTTSLIRFISDTVAPKLLLMQDPDEALDKVIKCLQMARKHRPDLLEARSALAESLFVRYHKTHQNDDYEAATSILDEITASSSSPRDSQDKSLAIATAMATHLAHLRSIVHATPENLEEAIYRSHASLGSNSAKDASDILRIEETAERRFSYFGSIEGVEASSGILPAYEPVSLMHQEIDSIRRRDKIASLLFGILNNDDTTKIDEAVEKGRNIFTSFSPRDPLKGPFFEFFGEILEKAFWHTLKIEYLNESISASRQLTENPFLQPWCFMIISKLSRSLLLRFVYFPGHCSEDLNEALELLSQCVNDARRNLPERFSFACMWADFARRNRHPTITRAYETALSLMQDTVHF